MSYKNTPKLQKNSSSYSQILDDDDNKRNKKTIMKASPRTIKLVWSYLPDWLLTIVLAALFFSLDKVEGYRREFSLAELSIRHTHAVKERVPNIALYFICFGAPVILQPVINLLTVRSWWDLHNATLGLILGLATTGSITQFVKITVGRPRPDLIDRCRPPLGSVDPPFGSSTWEICTRTDLLRDGFRSFPSGHSSLSFAGLGFLAYYLAGKLHLFDKRGHTGKAWLSLAPFSAAALVAISRSMDYRHHWQDILVGSLLGTVLSYFAYRQYFPPLDSEMSHKPHSPRIKRELEAILPIHHTDSDRATPDSVSPVQRPNGLARRYTDDPGSYEMSNANVGPRHGAGWRDDQSEHAHIQDNIETRA